MKELGLYDLMPGTLRLRKMLQNSLTAAATVL